MTYGIEVKNNLGSILIDQAYPNFGPTSTSVSTVSPNVSYPPSGTNQFLDLIFAATSVNSNGLVSIKYDGVQRRWQNSSDLGVPTNYRYYVFRDFADISGAGTGYGLQVFGEDNDVYFDSEQDFYFRVLAIGSDCVELKDMVLPSPTTNYTNLQNIFCMVNSSAVGTQGNSSAGGYVYNWASSTTGQITIKTGFKGVFPSNHGPSYIIIEVLGI
tara:strand:+ start:2144 stop:2785 length:642 start_codon:yes stop_codon:yes gene_type:complete